MSIRPSGEWAILAVDPGETTGVAACRMKFRGTMKETLLGAKNKKSMEVEGGWLEQAGEIARIMNAFLYWANVEKQIPIDRIHFVFEDFILRRRVEGGATGNLTSIWVMAGAIAKFTTMNRQNIHFQQASQAKGYATDARLKLWGLWTVGSAHERDAWRHIATLANVVVG